MMNAIKRVWNSGLSKSDTPVEGTEFLSEADIPPNSFVASANIETTFTPDVAELQRYHEHPVFIFDQNMVGYNAHHQLRAMAAKFQCTAFTAKTFEFWKLRLGSSSYPIPLSNPDKNDISEDSTTFARVKGQLFYIPTKLFFDLDFDKRNGVQFQRVMTDIEIPYERRMRHHVLNKMAYKRGVLRTRAWMYQGIQSYWEKEIDDGFYFKRLPIFNGRQDLPQYFFFTKLEANED